MRFGVLGPLTVWTDTGTVVPIPGAKVRALLADLLVAAGQPVSADRLVNDIWAEDPPGNPAGTLAAKASQLRRALEDAEPGGRDLVVSPPPGYRLASAEVDALRFRSLIAAARAAGDTTARVAALSEALGLWRGPAFADFRDAEFARPVIAQLEEQRLVAVEELAEARLSLGEYREVAGDLAVFVREYPLRERLRAALMRALYGAGRQAEALASYADLRRHLDEELGLDPSPELVALHRSILGQELEVAGPRPETVLRRRSSNIPAQRTALIGRDEDVALLRATVSETRLVTLTGPGGVGKTRLALATAAELNERFPQGIWLVELAPLQPSATDAASWLAEAVSQVLGIRATDGTDPTDLLCEVLADQELLLVLDNCEHVVEHAADLAELLLGAAPNLHILATSREQLRLPGEDIVAVEPLAVPPPAIDLAELEQSSAVQLFVTRARASDRDFTLDADTAEPVATLCRRLDGIPLALELAATRVRALGVHEMVARLDDRFRLLATGHRGAPPRQQTLTAMIDWSWDLLDDTERTVLRRLAVHAGGCTLEAAETVCATTVIDDAAVDALSPRGLSTQMPRSEPASDNAGFGQNHPRNGGGLGAGLTPTEPHGNRTGNTGPTARHTTGPDATAGDAGLGQDRPVNGGSIGAGLTSTAPHGNRAHGTAPTTRHTTGLDTAAGDADLGQKHPRNGGSSGAGLTPTEPHGNRTGDTAPTARHTTGPDTAADGRTAFAAVRLDRSMVADVVARLVDRSLVHTAGRRYRLLESVAAFSVDRLVEAGELEAVYRAHHLYYLRLAEQAEPELYGADQQRWLRRLDSESANLRAALDGFVRAGDAEHSLRLVNALAWYWLLRGRFGEARRWLAAALALSGSEQSRSPQDSSAGRDWADEDSGPHDSTPHDSGSRDSTPSDSGSRDSAPRDMRQSDTRQGDSRLGSSAELRARALAWDLGFAFQQGEFTDGAARRAEVLAAFDTVDNPVGRGRAVLFLAFSALESGDLPELEAVIEQALPVGEQLGDRWAVATAHVALAKAAHSRVDLPALEHHARTAARIFAEIDDRWGRLQAAEWLGGLAELTGDLTGAMEIHTEALGLAQELELWGQVCTHLCWLGWIRMQHTEFDHAAALADQALRIATEHGYAPGRLFASIVAAFTARRDGNPEVAERILRELLELTPADGEETPLFLPMLQVELGYILEHRDPTAALALHLSALDGAQRIAAPRDTTFAIAALAATATELGEYEIAATLLGTAEAIRATNDIPLLPAERPDIDRPTAKARAALGDSAFATAHATGAGLTPAQARDLAASITNELSPAQSAPGY
ncbi:BTAD domain-containing putative transcriptional regulator [Nocardia nepalensis]|uniref:BTAD domain-containing putative transcriptional regulator n=1 Tax=Nocardia nepalensis TaxID=3375448 RepID=UPI003B670C9B